ncbi:hypothetical protein BLNAU_7107 [Blattamonas nauphoetae]|uniref:Uncharacterized protein n=1 Tax=Blattamonas nauphoetae TaxID=2049346 RepID=A0ABQ9Y2G0_9EUKA|nr:hypothetical protein BLNAU_7107 [Blattamonas nauphoetae]
MDCSLFLSWNQKKPNSENETAVIFLSLIATVKLQPVLNDSLEAKVVKFLEYVDPEDLALTDAFRSSFTSFSDESFTKSINSVKVLLSSCNQAIIAASMKMLDILIRHGSPKLLLALVKANLPLQLIITLNPLSLSFAKTVEIHTGLVNIIRTSLWLSTPYGLEYLKIEDHAEQQAVHKTVLQQVLAPSEQNRQKPTHISNSFRLLLDHSRYLRVFVVGSAPAKKRTKPDPPLSTLSHLGHLSIIGNVSCASGPNCVVVLGSARGMVGWWTEHDPSSPLLRCLAS